MSGSEVMALHPHGRSRRNGDNNNYQPGEQIPDLSVERGDPGSQDID
jgi:hypothetical protein